MIKKLFFIAVTLAPCLAYGADPTTNLSVQVVPPGTGLTAPPQAAAQGFTTNMINADFTTGSTTGQTSVCLTCQPYSEVPGYQWYEQFNGLLENAGSNIAYPFNDNGTTVLMIQNGACCYGSVKGRSGISRISNYGTYGIKMPFNGYFEVEMRMPEFNTIPIWVNFWSTDVNAANGSEDGYINNEFDWSGEEHGVGGASSGAMLLGGGLNWNCWQGAQFWDPPYCAWGDVGPGGASVNQYIPGFDPTQYHKYASLVYQTDANHMKSCFYVDGVQIPASGSSNCAVISINNNSSGGVGNASAYCGSDLKTNCYEGYERVTPVVDLTSSCNSDEGSDFSCWGGKTAHVYVKTVRAWSCATWQTTECSQYNPN